MWPGFPWWNDGAEKRSSSGPKFVPNKLRDGVDTVCKRCHALGMINAQSKRNRANLRRVARRPKFSTREAWLVALAEKMAPWYGTLPPVKVSIGFPSGGKRGKAIGECWSQKCSKDGACQIFIHPGQEGEVDVAAILAHELVHAAVGIEAKHGPDFKRMALRIGLTGRMTATVAGEGFIQDVTPILKALGPLPHVALRHGYTVKPKQSTRMLKCECPECGYIVRTTRKWLDVAVPGCPVCQLTMTAETPEGE